MRLDPGLSPTPEQVEVLGTRIHCLRTLEVLQTIFDFVSEERPHSVYIVNAATLNLAYRDPLYRAVLNRGTLVLNDGTGVRWAARMRGVRLRDNHVGTDLIPRLCKAGSKWGLRLYLLGGRMGVAERAGHVLTQRFPGVRIVGSRHGYLLPSEEEAVCAEINARRPDLLLVAMGNPLQELWIDRHLAHLQRGVAVGVGGLFDHLVGNLRRAPLWVRRAGFEWVQILVQQPHKWRRYLLGNPLFLYRMRFGRPREIEWEGGGS
jgi:N-acetylglucosaminyldiphosphoundecaprenol N-acetyl-beta-D-mannosaminyltransferase